MVECPSGHRFCLACKAHGSVCLSFWNPSRTGYTTKACSCRVEYAIRMPAYTRCADCGQTEVVPGYESWHTLTCLDAVCEKLARERVIRYSYVLSTEARRHMANYERSRIRRSISRVILSRHAPHGLKEGELLVWFKRTRGPATSDATEADCMLTDRAAIGPCEGAVCLANPVSGVRPCQLAWLDEWYAPKRFQEDAPRKNPNVFRAQLPASLVQRVKALLPPVYTEGLGVTHGIELRFEFTLVSGPKGSRPCYRCASGCTHVSLDSLARACWPPVLEPGDIEYLTRRAKNLNGIYYEQQLAHTRRPEPFFCSIGFELRMPSMVFQGPMDSGMMSARWESVFQQYVSIYTKADFGLEPEFSYAGVLIDSDADSKCVDACTDGDYYTSHVVVMYRDTKGRPRRDVQQAALAYTDFLRQALGTSHPVMPREVTCMNYLQYNITRTLAARVQEIMALRAISCSYSSEIQLRPAFWEALLYVTKEPRERDARSHLDSPFHTLPVYGMRVTLRCKQHESRQRAVPGCIFMKHSRRRLSGLFSNPAPSPYQLRQTPTLSP